MIRNPLALTGAFALALAVVAACGERQEKAAEQGAESAATATTEAAEDVAAAVTPAAPGVTPTTAVEFLPIVTKVLLFEVDSSKLAEQKAQTPAVKALAKNVAADAARMRGELSAAAQKAGLQASVPTALDGLWATRLADLRAASPETFGDKYLDMQQEAHENEVAALETYAATGDNPELKAWAAAALPALRIRLAEVRALDASEANEPAAPAAAAPAKK